MRRSQWFYVYLGILAATGFVGCGSGLTTYPVTGTVMIEGDSDGALEPLTTGEVVFTSDKIQARGPVQPDGSFKLTTSTDRELEGIPVGKYKAFIIGANKLGEGTGFDRATIPLIDAKFTDHSTSGLEFTVEPKPNAYYLLVTKPGGTGKKTEAPANISTDAKTEREAPATPGEK